MAQQLGWAVWAFSIAGYLGMLTLIGNRFSVAAGTLAGTFLLTAPYIHSELYVRGDLSEYAAMMLVPGMLSAMLRFCEQPSRWTGLIGATLAAMVVMTHPAIGLVLFGLLPVLLAVASISSRNANWSIRGGTLLAFGAGLSAVYWFPVFRESRFSSVEKNVGGPDLRRLLPVLAAFSRTVMAVRSLDHENADPREAGIVSYGSQEINAREAWQVVS